MLGRLGAKDILIQLKGDNKDFKKSLKGADSSMSSFTKSVKAYGPLMAASFVAGTAAIVAMSVKMAAAEEVVNRQTESMLKSQGIMWSGVKSEVTDYINELERLTAYGDTDLQMAFNRMISSGISYKNAMESMNMVTDIAYTRDMDLVAAADLVSKAYNGQASSLKRYGIVVAEGVTGLEALNAVQVEVNKSFADADDRTESLSGKMESLKNNMDDTKEALGAELIPEISALGDVLVNASGGAEELGTFLGRLITMPIKLPRQLFEHKDMMKELNNLRKEGIDTEKELVEHLGLQSENLAEMTDKEFEHNTRLLTAAGYHEKSLKLTRARTYGLEAQNSLLESQDIIEKSILDTKKEQTREDEKQLSLAEKKIARDIEKAHVARREGRGGTSSMSAATAALYKEHYGIDISPERINPNIRMKSGL